MNRDAYAAILTEARKAGWPKRYKSDVIKHDKATLESLGDEPRFVWVLNSYTTRLLPLKRGAVDTFELDGYVPKDARLFVYDGGLREATHDEAREFLLTAEGGSAWQVLPEIKPETMEVRVPTSGNFVLSLPYEVRSLPGVKEAVTQAYDIEVAQMLRDAGFAKEPALYLGYFSKAGTQYIAEFSVIDRARPRKDEYNLHLQNTSQWVYAGAIVVENGRVTRHH